jgi:hypothetical protein
MVSAERLAASQGPGVPTMIHNSIFELLAETSARFVFERLSVFYPSAHMIQQSLPFSDVQRRLYGAIVLESAAPERM